MSMSARHSFGQPADTDVMDRTGRSTDVRSHASQSVWLDAITRELLTSGTLARYVAGWNVTGLTSNPTIFDRAIETDAAYDEAIRRVNRSDGSDEDVFFDLAIEDISRAADILRPTWERSSGVDGWVSIEVSPFLAHDTAATLAAAVSLRARIGRPNAMIKIPGTAQGLAAAEEAIFSGIPINITLLFSREQYAEAAEAYRRGIERRLTIGLDPRVDSVASLFVSRWDTSVTGWIPASLENRLGIAMGQRVYRTYLDLLESGQWRKILDAGARPQRLLFASTGTKSKGIPATQYVDALRLPGTVVTMPETTLRAFAERDAAKPHSASSARGDCEGVLARFRDAGVDLRGTAERLRKEGLAAFQKSWADLMAVIAAKRRSPSVSR